MLIDRDKTIAIIAARGAGMADVIELLGGEPEKADGYREAIDDVIEDLETMEVENAKEALLATCGTFDDLGKCGLCGKVLGSLSFIYDSEIHYCFHCGAKFKEA